MRPITLYKDKILNHLRSAQSVFLSGEELARKTGLSRTMVWKHIKSLERDGFVIQAVPSQGYRIVSSPDILRERDVKQGLKTKKFGREFVLLPKVDSTNIFTMDLSSKGWPEGTAVVAETQSSGKGRLGRSWISPKGNLYLSVILRPIIPVHKAPLITMMGAVAVASAIRMVCKVTAAIKWPNDILISGKKVSGLLTEMSAEQDRIRYIVLGIGIDVNMDLKALPPEVRTLSTSLAVETGDRINRTLLLQELLRSIECWYSVFLANPAEILREWQNLNMTVGSRIRVTGAGENLEGLAEGIDDDGRLLIRLDDDSVRFVTAGDVSIMREGRDKQ
jgi:BirA family biotin operon repressor/biotin-[acetyl-CoA-carboxylase] ligase